MSSYFLMKVQNCEIVTINIFFPGFFFFNVFCGGSYGFNGRWHLKYQKKIWPMSARFYIFSALMIAKCVHTYVYILSLYMNSQTNKPLNWFNSLKKHISVLKNHLWRNERLLNSYKRREKTIVALYYGLESKQCGLTGINMNISKQHFVKFQAIHVHMNLASESRISTMNVWDFV